MKKSWISRLAVSLLLAVVVAGGALILGGAKKSREDFKVNVSKLASEVQKMDQIGDRMTLVLWMPPEFWEANMRQQPGATNATVDQVLTPLRPYTLVAIVDGRMSIAGNMICKSEAELRSLVQIKDRAGKLYRPHPQDRVNATAAGLIRMMKPVLQNMLGPMGKNVHFFFFPAKDSKGRRFGEPKKEGTFEVLVGKRRFRWKLPLGALFPPVTCSRCMEECSGAWNYCPWCGTKLRKGR